MALVGVGFSYGSACGKIISRRKRLMREGSEVVVGGFLTGGRLGVSLSDARLRNQEMGLAEQNVRVLAWADN